eukprot:scaffold280_cov353-Prasinococcus_capsulatus_cf.AAC.2
MWVTPVAPCSRTKRGSWVSESYRHARPSKDPAAKMEGDAATYEGNVMHEMIPRWPSLVPLLHVPIEPTWSLPGLRVHAMQTLSSFRMLRVVRHPHTPAGIEERELVLPTTHEKGAVAIEGEGVYGGELVCLVVRSVRAAQVA